uniref:Uncharacterized protein n=1 Tax=Ananas comosus var. bracteatus TaxID=296719 RepID=A0A6V7QH40_ANACO|nr:unnamed protein product [Ananas comosus var. bracteatus]
MVTTLSPPGYDQHSPITRAIGQTTYLSYHGWSTGHQSSVGLPPQPVSITRNSLWDTDYFERMLRNCGERKNYEEQRLYLKFYVQLSKEVKEGESWKDVCKRLAVGVEGDLSAFKKEMAIVDYFANRIEEVRVKERYELFCHILDEVIMNKDFATVVAKIIEDNLYPDLHDEIRKCQKKSFVMDLKEHCQYGMHIDEAREHIKTAFFETWKIKYNSMARYFMLKMLIADKLRILPEVLQGLPEELNFTLENVSHI